jgi:hypothetical protein
VGVDRDQSVVGCATAQRSRPRIENAPLGRFVLGVVGLGLPLWGGIVLDEELPAHRRIFRRSGVEGRHLIGQAFAVIFACFENQHLEPGQGQASSQWPTTGT